MILKKPYAFLIKNFKLIHVLLTGLYIYLAFYISSILNFYNSFIKGTIGKINAINYITKLPYIAIIVSIIICLIMFILMNYKKKPKFLYAFLILLYIVVFIIIFITCNGLNIIYNSILETKTLLLYRDFLKIILLFQYGTIILTTIRAIGFDIKKFNFKEDINELDIDISDDEEVELVMGLNKHKLTQKLNRRIRETKYYFAENKIFVLVMIIAIISLILSTITIDKTIINKVYKQNEIFKTDNFNLTITDTYITNKSYNGDLISNQNTFLILKLYIEPMTKAKLNASNLVLKSQDNKYSPTKKYYNYFKDLGAGYKDQTLTTPNNYIIVYQIPNTEKTDNMQVMYTGSTKNIKVELEPNNLDSDKKNIEYNIMEIIDFTGSILTGSSYQINKYELKNKYTYNYTFNINGQEHTTKKYITSQSNTILYLELNSSFNLNITNYDFLSNYATIKYTINEKEYINKIISNKTPGNYDAGLYLEVDKELEKADNLWLELNIRNISYRYNLK